jgi:putative transposase
VGYEFYLTKSLSNDNEEGPRGAKKTEAKGRYVMIQEIRSEGLQLSITRSCQALEVSRSGYYKWTNQSLQDPSDETDLRDQIQEIALEFPRYGYRRVTAELRNRGYVVNHKRVLRLMREDNLLCLKKKFKPVTTDSSHGLPVYPNLRKNTRITRLNQAWASDITYIQLLHEHIYLAVIIDLFSRK